MRRAVRVVVAIAALLCAVAPADAALHRVPASKRRKPAIAVARRDTAHAAARADSSAHPNFAGRWTLSIARSTFGSIPGGQPISRTDVIEQAEPRLRQTLHMNNGGRRDTTVYDYRTDATPTVNRVDTREGRALHLVSTAKLLMLDTSLDERWTLSADGHTLTYTRHVKYGFGEGDQKLVFDRESERPKP